MRAACGKTARAVRKGGRRQRHATATSPDPTPAKPPNKPDVSGAEAVEERGPPEGNTASETRPGHRAGQGAPSALGSCAPGRAEGQGREVHRAPASRRCRPLAGGVLRAPAEGRAGGGWRDVARVRAGPRGEPSGPARARALWELSGEAALRAYIPKRDGRQRPLGDRRVGGQDPPARRCGGAQRIYEQDFLGFSYGFRPGRRPHDALDALATGIERKKVNWVLDADIRDYFSSLDQSLA